MLNELMDLHDTLKKQRYDLGVSHPNFRPCPKGKRCFCLSLDETGKVKDLTVSDLKMETVYRWQKDNPSPTFPVFNARAMCGVPNRLPPFHEKTRENIIAFIGILEDPRKKTLKFEELIMRDTTYQTIEEQVLQVVVELETHCTDLWDDDIEWIGKCLKDTPNAISMMLGPIPSRYQSLAELIRRSSRCDPKELKESIRSTLRQKLIKTREKIYAEALFSILTEAKKERRGKEHGKDFLYLLTIDDWNQYPSDPNWEKYPPYHKEIQTWMKFQFEQFEKAHCVRTGKTDAYGFDAVGANEVFSPVNVGGLGPTVPFASNDQIPCLKRYGLEGSLLFPAGKDTREMAAKGMAYILDPVREGVTWKGITKYESGKGKRNTVVFAYCTELKDANAVQFFGREDDDVNENIYRNEAATKLALDPFDGIAGQQPGAKILVNVLAAVDKGNTKLLASRHYKVSDLSDGVSRWQGACANIPNLDLPRFTVKAKKDAEKEIHITGAIPLYPLEAVKLLNSEWQQNGKMLTPSKRFGSYEALDFLFERDKTIIQRIEAGLNILVEKSFRALLSAKLKAHHDHSATKIRGKFKDSLWLHRVPTLYGLLLYKQGIRKEDYVKDDVFYLGRYFAVADAIYIQYHRDVRAGNIPLSLLGNDHMALALQNPMEAFVALSRRLAHPYISWAKRVGTDKEPGRIAKKCLKKIADLTEELSKTQLPTDIDDADRAKLLMGYLSYGAKSDRATDNDEESEKH
ncbi:MAG: hypothetical protein ABSG91_09105 [Syntrophobacteraceae bacterium]